MKGFIKYFDAKGWGFIVTENGDEIFFHKKDFKEKGILAVEFNVAKDDKGDRAINIKKRE